MREKMVDGTLMLFRIPGDSDNIIVNSQVTKNLILENLEFSTRVGTIAHR